MLCIHESILRSLGVPEEDLVMIRARADRTGVWVTSLFSFGARGTRSDLVSQEPEGERRLLLVGMADRYGDGARRGAAVTEMALSADGNQPAPLTPEQWQAAWPEFRVAAWDLGAVAALLRLRDPAAP